MTYDMASKCYSAGFIVDVVLFDKVFDVVSHNLLLDQLRLLGICSPLIDWIADFLIGRVMRVSGSSGGFMDVKSGVPQRSVLGPHVSYFC